MHSKLKSAMHSKLASAIYNKLKSAFHSKLTYFYRRIHICMSIRVCRLFWLDFWFGQCRLAKFHEASALCERVVQCTRRCSIVAGSCLCLHGCYDSLVISLAQHRLQTHPWWGTVAMRHREMVVRHSDSEAHWWWVTTIVGCNHGETVMRSTRSGIRFEAIIMRDSYIEEYP